MTSTTYDRSAVTDALIGMLESVVGALVDRTVASVAAGALVGDGRAPVAVHGELAPRWPYLVVHSLGGAPTSPMLAGDDMASLYYQVTSVGQQRNQVESMADYVRAAILDLGAVGHAHAITPARGRSKVIGRFLETQGLPIAEGDIWNFAEQFRLEVSIV